MKRYIAILSIIFGITLLFLVGCKKSNNDTIAFVGDEKDMKSCFDIYPAQYFPYKTVDYDTLMFPPDVEGTYEMNGEFVECTYEFYNGVYYIPVPSMSPKTIKIIIEEQVNGMAKLKFATKRNGDYNNWHTVDAYIYGDVYAETGNRDFIICYEYMEHSGDFDYDRGNIIKGTISEAGINNIHVWSIIKDRDPEEDKPMIYNYYGYEHYKADIAERLE